MLREELGRSEAELESMSSRFTELAAAIPDDIGFLGDRLSAILNAANSEADEIRAEALRLAEAVQVKAQESAAGILAEARLEYQLATKLRDDMEAQSEQAQADISQLRGQAVLDAAEILAEAKNEAQEVLGRVQRQVDAQVAVAKARLDELNQVRAQVVAQLKDFYETCTRLDRPWGESDPVRTISLAPNSPNSRSSYGAHSARDADVVHRKFGDVG